MTIGALSFLSPWLLTGLFALPVIYWLLRTVPPRPRQIEFPPTRILVGIENREKTPERTPWWLMLIRLLAAAMVISALADPILNPNREAALSGRGPLVIAVDNGWGAGAHWTERGRMVDRLIDEAEAANRAVVVIGTAEPANLPARIEAPNDARTRAAALLPQPFAPTRDVAGERLQAVLKDQSGVSVVWLTDGIDYGKAAGFIGQISQLASADLSVVRVGNNAAPLGLAASISDGGTLKARIVRPFGGQREGLVTALSTRGERLSEARFRFASGSTKQEVQLELPLELRNQVSRVALANERSAGAVHLLDAGSRWSRVGLFSGSEIERDQPLLGPLYYVRRALAPYAELVEHQTANLAEGLDKTLKRRPSMLVLTDVGTLAGDVAVDVAEWVEKGGILVRFAGPRLEKGGDELLTVPLRAGGRTLGGALSWSTPQPLAEFADDSVFSGLEVSNDVLIRRQVLADPGPARARSCCLGSAARRHAAGDLGQARRGPTRPVSCHGQSRMVEPAVVGSLRRNATACSNGRQSGRRLGRASRRIGYAQSVRARLAECACTRAGTRRLWSVGSAAADCITDCGQGFCGDPSAACPSAGLLWSRGQATGTEHRHRRDRIGSVAWASGPRKGVGLREADLDQLEAVAPGGGTGVVVPGHRCGPVAAKRWRAYCNGAHGHRCGVDRHGDAFGINSDEHREPGAAGGQPGAFGQQGAGARFQSAGRHQSRHVRLHHHG